MDYNSVNLAFSDMIGDRSSPLKPQPNSAASLEDMSEDDVTDSINDLAKTAAPNATPEQVTAAKVLAIRRLSGKGSTEGVEKAISDFSSAPEDPEVIMRSKEASGDSLTESLGGLFSLVLPVIIGGAIAGKRGALHAAVGAGSQKLSDMEREKDKRDRLAEIEANANIRAGASDLAFQRQLALVEERQKAKPSIEEKLDERRQMNEVDRKSKALGKAEDAYVGAQSFLVTGDTILKDFKEATKGMSWGEFQASREISGSAIGQLQSRVKSLVFDIVKAKQGSRPSDFDVKTLMKIVTGDFTAGPETAYTLLNNALKDSKTFVEARLEAAKALSEGREVSSSTNKTLARAEESARVAEEVGRIGSRNLDTLTSLSKQGAPLAKVKAGFAKAGVELSDELLDSLGFK